MTEPKKPEPTLEQRVSKLAVELSDALHQIKWMQSRGGFTDAKTHSMRALRLEQRLEVIETKTEAILDVDADLVRLLENHLEDRHDADLVREDSTDVISLRRIKKRLGTMMERLGLAKKQRDVHEARQSESRLRPSQAVAHS